MTDTQSTRRGARKSLNGTVVSNKMDKTVVVSVTRLVRHALYDKYVRRTDRYLAHDESNACEVGDLVTIVETRPLSSRKRWRIDHVDRSSVEQQS
jgi:small subunit ribosomal protein S17